MTLLVVLGIVVVVTILAALFLSLKSGRNRDGASAAGAVGDRQARGGSRSGRSPSLAGRARSLGRDKSGDHPGRRVAGRGGDDGFDDDYGAPRRPRGAGGPERSSLVTSGAGRQQDRGYPGPGFDDPGPVNPEAGTEVFGAGRYDTPEPPRARHGHGRGQGAPGGGFREGGRDGRPAAGFDFDTDPNATTAGFAAGPDAAGGRGGRRGRGPAGPGGPNGPGGPGGPAGFDDATMGASPFGAAPDPSGLGAPGGPRDEPELDDDQAGGRRRLSRIQKPHLRRDKNDLDEDPWPGYDEDDGAIPDDKYWQDMYSDRPLSTTARTAQPASDPNRDWGAPPADAGPSPAEPDPAAQGRGRRGRRRQEEAMGPGNPLEAGTGPRPAAPPDAGPGPGRRGLGRSRSAEEDPLTSESFSRHARGGTDSRSYQPPRDSSRPPSHGRRDPSTADTQSIQRDPRDPRDPRGYGPDPLTGPNPLSAPGPRGGRGGPTGGPPGGPVGGPPSGGLPPDPRRDPYSDNGYRNGTGPGGGYPDRGGSYPPPPPPGRGGTRPPASGPGGPGGPGAPGGPGYSPGYPGGNGYSTGGYPTGDNYSAGNGYQGGNGYAPSGGYPPANGRPPAPGGPGGGQGRRARPALPPPGQGGEPGPGGPGGTGQRPAYNPNGSGPYPGGTGGGPAYPGDPAYPGGGYPPNQGGPNGTGEHGRRRRGTGQDGRDGQDGQGGSRRRPDDGYDDQGRRY